MYDGRGLKCPLNFVHAKQHLLRNKTKVFLFDDDVSLYNFCNYLTNQNVPYQTLAQSTFVEVRLTQE